MCLGLWGKGKIAHCCSCWIKWIVHVSLQPTYSEQGGIKAKAKHRAIQTGCFFLTSQTLGAWGDESSTCRCVWQWQELPIQSLFHSIIIPCNRPRRCLPSRGTCVAPIEANVFCLRCSLAVPWLKSISVQTHTACDSDKHTVTETDPLRDCVATQFWNWFLRVKNI